MMVFWIIRGTWRERRSPSTLADFAAAMDDALERFPDDSVHRVARVQADLTRRELFGVRKFES